MAILDHIRGDDGMVGRLDPIAQGENLLLDFVYPVCRDSGRRQDGQTVPLLDADNDITSAQIVKVIGKGAERMDDGLRIPTFLEFEALTFDSMSLKECVNIDWQAGVRHNSPDYLIDPRLAFPGVEDLCLATRHVLHIARDHDEVVDAGRNGDQAVDDGQFLAPLLGLAQQRPGPGNFRFDLHEALIESHVS